MSLIATTRSGTCITKVQSQKKAATAQLQSPVPRKRKGKPIGKPRLYKYQTSLLGRGDRARGDGVSSMDRGKIVQQQNHLTRKITNRLM